MRKVVEENESMVMYEFTDPFELTCFASSLRDKYEKKGTKNLIVYKKQAKPFKIRRDTVMFLISLFIVLFALNPSEGEHCKQMGHMCDYNDYTNLIIASVNKNDNLMRHRRVVSFGILNKVFEISVEMY